MTGARKRGRAGPGPGKAADAGASADRRRPAFVFADPAVAAAFAAFPEDLRGRLMELRHLILETAHATPPIGPIVETLKWGEPAYLPETPRVGTTVRINALKGSRDRYAAYFHCQTTLVETFRELYPDTFSFQGNRAIVLGARDRLPRKALGHCIALALTYHLGGRAHPR
jgi:hypothetical protein